MFRAVAVATVLFAAALASPALAAAPDASAGDPVATAAATCKTPTDDAWGPTYVVQLRTSRAGCAKGRAVVKAYYRCRIANGGKRGTCDSRVKGYRCREQRLSSIKTQFDARVTCTRAVLCAGTFTTAQYPRRFSTEAASQM